jgi:hypothetical protein
LADIHKSLLTELSNALLRLIAQHSQVELTVEPTVEPTGKSTIETTVDIHQYTTCADRNQFDKIFINTQSKMIAIN